MDKNRKWKHARTGESNSAVGGGWQSSEIEVRLLDPSASLVCSLQLPGTDWRREKLNTLCSVGAKSVESSAC